jgi:phosphate transport system substrate-binding protein
MNLPIDRRSALLMAVLLVLALPAGAVSPAQDPPTVDPNLSPYRPVAALTGKLTSVGSDTLHPLIQAWGDRFKGYYPEVELQIEAKGSNTAPPALIEGVSQLCPMSRALNAREIEGFEKKFGYKPLAIRAAVDSICIFVHKDNPIPSISLEQVDGIFSAARRRGGKELRKWGDLGLTGEWADRPIHAIGRNGLSGTRQFFRDHALKGAAFREDIKEEEGSAAIITEVAGDPGAVGYCGVGYGTAQVRALPLADAAGRAPVEPTAANAYKGDYSLSRVLFVYVNPPADPAQKSAVREFIRMICSREGQEIVAKEGYFPMPAAVAREEQAKIN